jgi:hypothetical protein
MEGKRKASTRASVASAPRGRPRPNTHCTYAPVQEDQVEKAAVQEQPLALEVHQAPKHLSKSSSSCRLSCRACSKKGIELRLLLPQASKQPKLQPRRQKSGNSSPFSSRDTKLAAYTTTFKHILIGSFSKSKPDQSPTTLNSSTNLWLTSHNPTSSKNHRS